MIQNFKILLCMYSLIVILNFLYLIFNKTYKKKMFWFICVLNLCPLLNFLVTVGILYIYDRRN